MHGGGPRACNPRRHSDAALGVSNLSCRKASIPTSTTRWSPGAGTLMQVVFYSPDQPFDVLPSAARGVPGQSRMTG
jgi:hypothetical protein